MEKTKKIVGPFFLSLFLSLNALSLSPVINDQALRKEASQAQIQYQNEVYDFLLKKKPEYKTLLSLNRDLQISLIKRGDLRYEFLKVNHPEAIERNKGLSRWLNFEWKKEWEEILLKESLEYQALSRQIENLRQTSASLPEWPKLREAMPLFKNEPEWIAIYMRLDKKFKELEEQLK